MMTGTITDGRPYINLIIRGAGVQALAEFTVDTGYSGTLTLPLAECLTLGLTRRGKKRSTLADGSQIELEIYRLTVFWDSTEREFDFLAIGEERLLGAQVLTGYELCLNYSTNTLTIEDAQP